MTERVRSQYTNLVKMKLDQRSINKTRSQIRNFRSEVAKMMKVKVDLGLGSTGKVGAGGIGKATMQQPTRSVRQPRSSVHDGHVQALRNQEKFNMLQKDSLDTFFESNRLAGQMSTLQKEKLTTAVMGTRNAKQLRLTLRRQRNELLNNLATKKRLTKEAEKQLMVQRRFNASITQMVGGLASAYLAVNAFKSSMNVGIEMEGMEKSFLVVAKNGAEAAETMAWIRKESYRLGSPLITASKGFAAMMAAAGDKVALDDLKAIFTGIQEAGVALGLSQDDLGGITLAVKQMLSKGKVQAEELTRQLGDRLPFAMRAIASAAVNVGLINKSLSSQEREAAIFKLMEDGKLLSHQILPAFGRELSRLANNNDELAKALEHNLSPALGRAQNRLVEMQKSLFDGLKPSIMFAVEGFDDLGSEARGLSYFLGKILGGAILTLSALIRLPIAALMDLGYWLKTTLNLTDKQAELFKAWIPTLMGVAGATWLVVKAVMALVAGYRLLKVAKTAAGVLIAGETATGTGEDKKGKGGGSTGRKGTRWNRAPKVTSLLDKGKGLLGKGGSLLGRLGGPLALATAGFEGYDRLSTTNERTENIYKYLLEKEKIKQSIDVNVNLNPNGLQDVIDVSIDKSQNNMLDQAMMNLSSGGY